MQTQQPQTYQPRFIHQPDTNPDHNHSGFTVAYVRNNTHAFFAWTLVSKKDRYEKAVGREVSSNILENNIESIVIDPDMNYSIDLVKRVGSVSIETVISVLSLHRALGDRAQAELTMMDFKHAAISYVIAYVINEAYE